MAAEPADFVLTGYDARTTLRVRFACGCNTNAGSRILAARIAAAKKEWRG